MSYKTILVHVDESGRASERIKIAAAIAMTQSAHLIGSATTGASRYLAQTRLLAELDPHLKTHLTFLRVRAQQGLAEFDATAQKLGLPSFEMRLVDDEAGGGICLQARFADLVVIGQYDPQEASPVVMPDFPQYVVLYSGRPVLLVPHTGRFDQIGQRVLIAWDGSMEATRAITSALPLLKRAQLVEVAAFNEDAQTQTAGEVVLYLKRYGIQAEVLRRDVTGGIGEALLALAAALGSDLIVMGGYGHVRFREILLGNVTRTLLETARIPVLMSR
jgi:nucleotide-binding universal stress UspA family protein